MMRSPMIVCWRMYSHSSASSARGAWRIASGIAILPMSWSAAARRRVDQVGRVEAELAADGLGELGDVVDVVAQVAVMLGGDAQQHVVHGLVDGAPAAALVRVHALVGDPQRVRGVAGFARASARAPRSTPIVEALAALAQRVGGRGRSSAAGRVGSTASTQNSSPPMR